MIEPYEIAVIQAAKIAPRSGGLGKLRENVEKNLQHYSDLIDMCCGANAVAATGLSLSDPVRMVTFGEFGITGPYAPPEITDHRFTHREVMEHLALRIPGSETDVLAQKAKQHGIYVAAVNFEADPEWPDFHFNTAFIINPEGKIILKYRKTLTNNPVECACTAHDVMDEYTNPITGKYDPFPVVDTAIGRFGCMICADLASPEIPRIYAMKGADVVLHLTSGNADAAGGPRPQGIIEAIKRVRAWDNVIYFVQSNWGPNEGSFIPTAISGHSAIVDYLGNVLAESDDSTEKIVRAKVDIEACRKQKKLFYRNPLTQMRTELYAPYYHRTVYPPNTFLEGGPLEHNLDTRQQALFSQALTNLEDCQDYYSETEIG